MKIHLHGDSWCYLWPRHYDPEFSDWHTDPGFLTRNQPGVINYGPLGNTNDTFGNILGESQCVDFYTMMFNHLGHEVINGGVPGLDLTTVAEWITLSELQSDADLHVVMAPFMFRHAGDLAKIPKHCLESSQILGEWLADEQVKRIRKISNHAARTKTHYIIIGAHGPLSGKCETVLNEYSHIMYYDWLFEFNVEVASNYSSFRKQVMDKPQYFRWATTVDYKKVHLESWSEDVITTVSNHLESGRSESILWKLVYPDNGHPNAMLMMDIVSKITKCAKDLGIN